LREARRMPTRTVHAHPARKALMSDPNAGVSHGHSPLELLAPVEPPRSVPLRISEDVRRLDAWALVLLSRRFRPLVRWGDGSFELHVPHAEVDAARLELDASDAEERELERTARADVTRDDRPPRSHAGLASAFISLLLLGFFAVTGPRAAGSAWFAAGASDAERVLHGEWWRTITALTLHADSAHVVSNVGVGAFVIGAAMRSE
jgi:rhomboid protease GluP